MYRVLIVDDEVLLRAGLKTMIDWEQIGFTVVAEASNGEMGFEQYKKHNPDVVITDIIMPKRDGLWLVDKIRKEDKYVSILVLTCHDEFSYAREALKAGADDYILKSEVEDEEILGIMDKVKKKLNKQNKDKDINQTVSINKSGLRRALFIDMIKAEFNLQTELKERSDFIGMPLENTHFVLASVSISDPADKDESSNDLIRQAVINILFNLLEEQEIEYVYCHHLNAYHFLMSSHKLSITEVKRIFISANQGAQQYFDCALQVVYSDLFSDATILNEQYESFMDKTEILFYSREDVFYLENTEKIHFEELNAFDVKKKYSQILLIDFIIQDNMQSAKEFIEEMYQYFLQKKAHPSTVKLFSSDLVGSLFHQYSQLYDESQQKTHEHYHYQINNARTLKEVCNIIDELALSVADDMRQYVKTNAKLLTNRAVQYIEGNYDKKISLKDVAEILNFSKHYLCSIFKKETGENMSYYINKLRIEKAKKLLLKQDRKIKEVFEEVGFSNQQYFSKVFKKMTGMTVLEYKEKINSQ